MAAFVATVGLVATASRQMDTTFDALRATQVSFTGGTFVADPDAVVTQVAGAVAGGSLGQLFGGTPVPVRGFVTQRPDAADVVILPVTRPARAPCARWA